MPRPPRLHVPGGCYHVILRGNHREALFGNAADRQPLNEIIADVITRFAARVHSFCWMSNHHRHTALRTSGHLFERRHRAKLVDAYFLTLLRYIHMNPVKARIVQDPAHYPWSSHRAYLGTESIPWLTTDFGLSLFSADLAHARTAYQHFMLEPSDADLDAASHPEDPRILGSDQFINQIPFIPYRPRSPLTLDQLAMRLCQPHNISVDLLRSPSRRRHLTAIRIELARQAIELCIATSSDVARFLNRDPSALCKLFARYTSTHS